MTVFPHPSRDNFLIDLDGLVREEGRVSSRHLVHEHAQRPPVHGLVVALSTKFRNQGLTRSSVAIIVLHWAPTLLRMISGARYSGVPHSVQVRPFTRLANPKSVICG